MKKSNLCVMYSQRDGYKFEDGTDRKTFGESVVTSVPCYNTVTTRAVKRIIHLLLKNESSGFSSSCKCFSGENTEEVVSIIKKDAGVILHKSALLKYITTGEFEYKDKKDLCLSIDRSVDLKKKGRSILWAWNGGPPEEQPKDYISTAGKKSISTPECVYFIGNIQQGVVKIGFTRDLCGRLSAISTYTWHEVYHLYSEYTKVDEGIALEGQYHKKYSHHHIRGEWFKIDALTEHLGLKNTSELWQWVKERKLP